MEIDLKILLDYRDGQIKKMDEHKKEVKRIAKIVLGVNQALREAKVKGVCHYDGKDYTCWWRENESKNKV